MNVMISSVSAYSANDFGFDFVEIALFLAIFLITWRSQCPVRYASNSRLRALLRTPIVPFQSKHGRFVVSPYARVVVALSLSSLLRCDRQYALVLFVNGTANMLGSNLLVDVI